MSFADVKKNAQERMNKSIETLQADLAKVRTGRAHTGILDHVTVDYYGTPTPLTRCANVTLIDARTIGVQPFEKKMVERHRKSDPRFRPRPEPVHLGRTDPRADPGR